MIRKITERRRLVNTSDREHSVHISGQITFSIIIPSPAPLTSVLVLRCKKIPIIATEFVFIVIIVKLHWSECKCTNGGALDARRILLFREYPNLIWIIIFQSHEYVIGFHSSPRFSINWLFRGLLIGEWWWEIFHDFYAKNGCYGELMVFSRTNWSIGWELCIET